MIVSALRRQQEAIINLIHFGTGTLCKSDRSWLLNVEDHYRLVNLWNDIVERKKNA